MTAPSRLDRFGVDMRRLPGVVGLAHFTFALQRQEEVLVRVRGDGRHRVAAAQTLHAVEDGHAPSSPASSPVVAAPWDGSDGMEFLVAVYKKYDRPMAWCRTRVAAHEFALSAVPAWSRGNTGAHAKRPVSNWDYPLRLPAVERWPSDSSVNVGDVLCDLATAVLSPPPANPLRVDYAALPPASSDPKAHLAHLMAVAALLAVLSSATPTDDVMADVGRYDPLERWHPPLRRLSRPRCYCRPAAYHVFLAASSLPQGQIGMREATSCAAAPTERALHSEILRQAALISTAWETLW